MKVKTVWGDESRGSAEAAVPAEDCKDVEGGRQLLTSGVWGGDAVVLRTEEIKFGNFSLLLHLKG